MLRHLKWSFHNDKNFNRQLISLVVLITLQNLISALAITVDVVMLGFINQSLMSAVSLAGQITFVLTLFYMGLATGAGVLTAQYWGKKDLKTIQRVLNIGCIYSIIISCVFYGLSFFMPDTLMQLFTKDGELIRYGSSFLQVISFSYLVSGVSQMYFSVIRSMENARFSAWISSICLIVNILLNALSIFVLCPGDPERAVIAVALSTVIARVLELCCCIIHSGNKKINFKFAWRDMLQHKLQKDFLKYTLPVQGNYIVWGCALTASTAIIGHFNADMVAANSVASVVKNLAIVFCGGLASGGAILVGKYLGKGEIEKAISAGKQINAYAVLFGILAGIIVLIIKPFVFQIVNLNEQAQSYLSGMLFICAYYCIPKSINSSTIGGIFVAGGDSKFGFWCDTIVMWGIILPLGYLSAFVWQLPPITLFAILSLDEVIKSPIALYRYRKFKWLNNITRDLSGAGHELVR
ncbi:MATE family efflux transporter [Paenibacillus radicis (ex Gao et al. 2016)]|uniref:MATE family efflux transporter n=1 Tax=Paenibacillus radicis (ex Gao et al. 2016) TaxID=1737354 RepID=A0A917GQ72_9BACL|nr:MATE family efflux transporter [Paenibacillus radicis (ex Gao et al. 2016)]GGG53336.1 MATE family efflux transporter [Paenibacillus radicis (ex Gao et al. 2016)]